MRLTLLLLTGFAIAALVPSAFASSAQFTELVVFGDSLSDTGNDYIANGSQSLGPFGTNYWSGTFTDEPTTTPATNGPIGNWVDQFSARAGIADPAPAWPGGTNYAFGGASTGSAQPTISQTSLQSFQPRIRQVHPQTLYMFYGVGQMIFKMAATVQSPRQTISTQIS